MKDPKKCTEGQHLPAASVLCITWERLLSWKCSGRTVQLTSHSNIASW